MDTYLGNGTACDPIAYHVRVATMEDATSLQEIIDLSVRTLHTTFYTPDVITGALKSVYRVDIPLLADGNYYAITHTSSPETIIGCGAWSHRSTLPHGDRPSSQDPTLFVPMKDAARLKAMYVHPDWTRKGVGKLLMKACEGAARDAGFRKMEMGATLSGVPFYESLGYIVVDKKQRDLEDGLKLELMTMKKILALDRSLE